VNNRQGLFELAKHEFDVVIRYQNPLAVIMFDLDHFEQVNDRFGPTAGDQLLERVTQVARTGLRSADMIGRYGGDKFIIMLPMTDAQHAFTVAERIRTGAAAISVETDQGQAFVTLSLGIAEVIHTPKDESVGNVIERADKALEVAKTNGGNRTAIFENAQVLEMLA
jgi:diguanylate cyclase (GGDEF)-like protein